MSKLTTSDSKRTGDSGHVTWVSSVRRKRWRAVNGAVQVHDGDSYWSSGALRTQGHPSISNLTTSDPTSSGDSGHVTAMSPVRWEK